MRLFPRHPHLRIPGKTGNSGMTILELIFSSTIGVVVMGALMVMFLEVAKQSRRTLAQATVEQEAGLLQDRLAGLIRSMSVNESVIFGGALSTDSPFYRRVIVAKGASANYPREEVIYDATTLKLTHYANRTLSSSATTLFGTNPAVVLRNLYFFASLKPGGIPDSSALNVYFEMDDDGNSGRRAADGSLVRNKLSRSFTIKMRNP